ncbi:MAG: hypothetical protein WEB58_04410 [Planctomycetaceae bacterium]
MPNNELNSLLEKVRRRQLVVGMTAGFFWAIIAAVLALLVGMWLDVLWELSPQARIVAGFVAAVAGFVLLAWLAGRAWRSARGGFCRPAGRWRRRFRRRHHQRLGTGVENRCRLAANEP